MPTPTLSILIPVFNEAANLPELFRRLPKVLEPMNIDWEIVFVDDGSSDTTLSQLREAHDRDGRLKTISLSRNFGKEIATAAGLRYVSGDAVIMMDADLQHPPEILGTFVDRWREGYQVVYRPTHRPRH